MSVCTLTQFVLVIIPPLSTDMVPVSVMGIKCTVCVPFNNIFQSLSEANMRLQSELDRSNGQHTKSVFLVQSYLSVVLRWWSSDAKKTVTEK